MDIAKSFAMIVIGLSVLSSAYAVADDSMTQEQIARLSSCDVAVQQAAVKALLQDKAILQNPITLFHIAMTERAAGHKESAAFLYLAARLRVIRQAIILGNGGEQAIQVMDTSVGGLIMPILEKDPQLASRIVQQVLNWDRVTPDPFRDKDGVQRQETGGRLKQLTTNLENLPAQIKTDSASLAKAADEDRQADRQFSGSDAQCKQVVQNPVMLKSETDNINHQAESFATSNTFVLAHARNQITEARVLAWQEGDDGLPKRLTVNISTSNGSSFLAEIDAHTLINSDHTFGPTRLSLVCLTNLWIGQRNVFWKDVCRDDPQAIKP